MWDIVSGYNEPDKEPSIFLTASPLNNIISPCQFFMPKYTMLCKSIHTGTFVTFSSMHPCQWILLACEMKGKVTEYLKSVWCICKVDNICEKQYQEVQYPSSDDIKCMAEQQTYQNMAVQLNWLEMKRFNLWSLSESIFAKKEKRQWDCLMLCFITRLYNKNVVMLNAPHLHDQLFCNTELKLINVWINKYPLSMQQPFVFIVYFLKKKVVK